MGKFIAVIGPNVRRYVTFASPDPWGGDGVVFADPAHDRTIF